ncbi:MAG: family 78 glycoside hydrolase catalytic domain [Promethearchaeia archaeon]
MTSNIKISNLRCEYLINPLGIDVKKPRLSWILESNTRNQYQSAYQIIIASKSELLNENKGDLWDSGKVKSNDTNQIEYNGKELKSRMFCYWKVRVWDKNDEPSDWSNSAFWSMGLLEKSDWKSKWIGVPPRKRPGLIKRRMKKKYYPSPYLRKEFSINKKIKRAILYTSALGEYEFRINGKRVDNRFFAPEWTDYYKKVQYQTYDVTNFLKEGKNAIGAILGDGWFAGDLGPGLVINHSYYGVNLRLIAQLEIEFEDGSSEIIISDDSWKYSDNGPIRESDHFLGETYDISKEFYGWDSPDFNDKDWKGVYVEDYDDKKPKLVAQMNEPIRIIKEIVPISVSEPKKGVFVFDLGQNIAGFCRIKLNPKNCESNSIIILKHGEILNKDGTVFRKNLRRAKARDKYIIGSLHEEREFQPHFTYHGFRYVEIIGLKDGYKPTLDMITGCVVSSSCKIAGSFECSDNSLNKLWNCILWTQIDNLISVPTDCPQRNERMGWMGDAQIFCQTSILNMDMAAFYNKWIKDIRDAQWKNGRYPDFVPYPYKWGPILRMIGTPAWADCGLIIPWNVYLNYNDKRIIEQHYESAKRFIDYIHLKNPNLIWRRKRGINYGDWLNGDKIKVKNYPKKGAAIPKIVFSTAYFANSTRILAKMADILGKAEEAKFYYELAEKIKNKFIQKFVKKNGKVKGDNQASYALALNFNLIPKKLRANAIKFLLKAIEKYNYRVSTGFCTTLKMMLELVKAGHSEIAFRLLFNRDVPSWFYMIDHGATTIWERWDGLVENRGVQTNLMNSFNHFTYGSIGEFMYRIILGLNPDDNVSGYKHFIIKPILNRRILFAKGHYNSILGKIAISWKINDNKFSLDLSIPPNSRATVFLPTNKPNDILESGKEIKEISEIKILEKREKYIILKIDSGNYHFISEIEALKY